MCINKLQYEVNVYYFSTQVLTILTTTWCDEEDKQACKNRIQNDLQMFFGEEKAFSKFSRFYTHCIKSQCVVLRIVLHRCKKMTEYLCIELGTCYFVCLAYYDIRCTTTLWKFSVQINFKGFLWLDLTVSAAALWERLCSSDSAGWLYTHTLSCFLSLYCILM